MITSTIQKDPTMLSNTTRSCIANSETPHTHWNTNPTPFAWTATTDEILAKVRVVQTNIRKLVENNTK